MFTAIFTASGLPPKVLARTSRDFMEVNFRVNHQRQIQVQEFLRADFAAAYGRKNARNIVTFDAYRGVNEAEQLFKDVEEAALFMIDHPPSIGDEGILQVQFIGPFTNAIRFFDNAVLSRCEPIENVGITLGLTYEFNCGEARFSPA